MLTLARTTTLHVFPTHGAWVHSDSVMLVTTVGDLPISEAYNYMTYERGELIVERDVVFDALSLPDFRQRYDDVIVYSEPYSELWCMDCSCPRYPMKSRFGFKCDACGSALDAPF